MNMELVSRLVDINTRRKAMDLEVKKLKAEQDAIALQLADEFVDDGVKAVKTGAHTVYLHSQLWAGRLGDGVAAVKALEEVGLEDCVMVGTQRLSALVREREEQGGEGAFFRDYPELEAVIKMDTRTSVRVRKA